MTRPSVQPGDGGTGPDSGILAAGAVLYHRTGGSPGGVEVALINRPRRDDWTFPKGKLEPGEHVITAAVREVTEETGIRPVLGRPLATVRYEVESRPKRVDYWAALVGHPPPAASFVPNDEVDNLAWLPSAEAAARLTYTHDLRLLDLLLSPGGDTVPCILLRHASAGRKSTWPGDDLSRPLDGQGLAEAQALAGLLACYAPTRVISSAAERCLGTVRPYAERIGVAIETEPAFTVQPADGEEFRAAMEHRMTELIADPSPMVICAHRENISLLLDQARATLSPAALPTPSPDDPAWSGVEPHHSRDEAGWSPPKGGFWVLHIAGGQLSAVEHHDLTT